MNCCKQILFDDAFGASDSFKLSCGYSGFSLFLSLEKAACAKKDARTAFRSAGMKKRSAACILTAHAGQLQVGRIAAGRAAADPRLAPRDSDRNQRPGAASWRGSAALACSARVPVVRAHTPARILPARKHGRVSAHRTPAPAQNDVRARARAHARRCAHFGARDRRSCARL